MRKLRYLGSHHSSPFQLPRLLSTPGSAASQCHPSQTQLAPGRISWTCDGLSGMTLRSIRSRDGVSSDLSLNDGSLRILPTFPFTISIPIQCERVRRAARTYLVISNFISPRFLFVLPFWTFVIQGFPPPSAWRAPSHFFATAGHRTLSYYRFRPRVVSPFRLVPAFDRLFSHNTT